MQPTTRLRILDHLRKNRSATVVELSRWMGMSGANLRHHLSILEQNDLVEVVGQRREGAGRPKNVFALSRRVLGDGLDGLASALLDEWLAGRPEGAREAALLGLARRLAAGFAPEPLAALTGRLIETVRFLNRFHYQARWEASPAGPRLVLGHCPYLAILDSHPELCRLDALLLGECLGREVEQTARLERLDRGLPVCIFRPRTGV